MGIEQAGKDSLRKQSWPFRDDPRILREGKQVLKDLVKALRPEADHGLRHHLWGAHQPALVHTLREKRCQSGISLSNATRNVLPFRAVKVVDLQMVSLCCQRLCNFAPE